MDKYTVEWREIETASFKMVVEADSERDAMSVVQELMRDGKIDSHPDLEADINTETQFDGVFKSSN